MKNETFSRITQKHDIEANWIKAGNAEKPFVPFAGETIYYDADENYTFTRTKVGDGVTNINDLPFSGTQADWGQGDATAADYVKNRTHYESISSELVTVLSDTQVEYQYEEAGLLYFSSNLDFEWNYDLYQAGEEIYYTVDIQGKRFEFQGINNQGGNIGVKNWLEDGNLFVGDIGDGPWVTLLIDPINYGIDLAEFGGNATITVKSLSVTKTLKTLDEKYIPVSIARKSSVDTLKTEVNTVKTNVSKCIKSINGKTPNSSGAVNITYAYEDLTNKPFGIAQEEGYLPLGILDGRSFEFTEQNEGLGLYIERIAPPDFVYTDGYYITWDGVEYTLGEPS